MAESEWTVSTLKELADEREKHRAELRELDREAVRVAVQSQRDQRTEDKEALAQWREVANHAKEQAKDQAATFVTRDTLDATLRNLAGDRLSGRSDARGTVVMIVGVVGGALGIVAFAVSIFINFLR